MAPFFLSALSKEGFVRKSQEFQKTILHLIIAQTILYAETKRNSSVWMHASVFYTKGFSPGVFLCIQNIHQYPFFCCFRPIPGMVMNGIIKRMYQFLKYKVDDENYIVNLSFTLVSALWLCYDSLYSDTEGRCSQWESSKTL